MNVEEFDFELKEEQIAQTPYEKRDEAKLLVLDRKTGEYNDKVFKEIIDLLEPGDCLVLNETKVLPARLIGKKETGAEVEVLLLKEIEGEKNTWEAMVRPGKKLKPKDVCYFGNLSKSGQELKIDHLLKIEILEVLEDGIRKVKLEYRGILNEVLDKIGAMPLPPYITKKLEDNSLYQTVYAKNLGSAAAPTAGLHFTDELLKQIEKKGVKIARITLHVGLRNI